MARKSKSKAGRNKRRAPAQTAAKKVHSAAETEASPIPNGFLDFFNSSSEGMILLDCQSWNILEVNPSFESMLGYSRGDVVGKKLWDLPEPNNGELLKRSLFEVFQKGCCHLKYLPIKTAGNELLNFELNTTMVNGGKSRSLLCFIRPAENSRTPIQKISGDSIIQSHNVLAEQFSTELIENANLIVIFLNSEGEITLFNRKAEKFTGKSWDEVRGKKFYNVFIAPKSREKIKLRFYQIMNGEEAIDTHDYPIRNSQGLERLIKWRNSIVLGDQNEAIGLLSIGEDITDLKVLERRLKLYSDAIKSSIDSMMITDLNGYIIYNNKASETIYGYSSAELSGKNIHILYPGGMDQSFISMFDTLTLKGSWHGEVEHKHKNGSRIPIYQTMSQIKDDLDREIAILSVCRDISEPKKLENDLQRAKRSSELFLDVLTFELNNLNQGVLIQLDQFKRSVKTSTGNIQNLNTACIQLQSCLKLIENVKKITKIEHNEKKLQNFELEPVLKRCMKQTEHANPSKKIRFWGNFGQQNYNIFVDEFIDDLFINLLDNAVKFDKHPVIEIGINVNDLKISSKKFVKISIIDSGCGIPQADKATIFEQFYRNIHSSSNSGLGLAIVKSLIDRYGGEIRVIDRVPDDCSKGSVFCVLLPLENEKISD